MSLRKIVAGALVFLTFFALPLSALAFERLPMQMEEIQNARQAQELADQLEAKVEYLLVTDAAYAKELARAEEIAAQIFEDKRRRDAALNTRTASIGATDMTIQAVPWGSLLTGDVMHINNKKFFNIYAMYYSHSGIYNGSNTVYESNSDGVKVLPLSSWQQGQPVALGYTKNKSYSQVTSALTWAKNTYGTNGRTPYNWNFLNKTTDSALYCSQLVWKMHQHMAVNVDSNHWSYSAFLTAKVGLTGTTFAYAAVAPDEVYLSSNIIYYHAN